MSELKPCPFCGGKPTAIETHPGRGELYCGKCDLVMCGDNAKTPEELTQAWNTRACADGQTSDGYHTFDELYYHRTALFACLVASQPRQTAFKSWKHADGTMYEGMFIVGIYTSRGWCTYHCEAKWWPLFDCMEREFAPEWDGHTSSDAIHRLMHDLLPEQEVSGEVEQ